MRFGKTLCDLLRAYYCRMELDGARFVLIFKLHLKADFGGWAFYWWINNTPAMVMVSEIIIMVTFRLA